MKILANGRWRDGYLDYALTGGDVRVQVLAWKNLQRLDDLYFVPGRSIRLLVNYLRDIGPLQVVRKVASRRDEAARNDKWVSCGVGRVLEAAPGAAFRPGHLVAFVAPAHPACVERVVLPRALVAPLPAGPPAGIAPGEVAYLPARGLAGARWWEPVSGWARASGADIDGLVLARVLAAALRAMSHENWTAARRLPADPPSPIAERTPPVPSTGRKRAVFFGYGNYAKTVVLPHLRPLLHVRTIHEIDPTQIPPGASDTGWDTAPAPRPDEEYDALFVAGYHHTHAPLALEALRRGRYAVVEKPVVVDEAQYRAVLQALDRGPMLFSCFHKRYQPFNDMAWRDLGVRPGDPVSYHCTVYHVSLPARHWYRWPNSHSRLVSNGCHWIDHFLYMNGFAEVRWSHLVRGAGGAVNVSVELENGAFFTMVLTGEGSGRIGPQDYVEMRAGRTTVHIVNGTRYRAEGADRVLRTARANKLGHYERMYRSIARKIAAGEPGDPVQSFRVSSGLILELERRYQELGGPEWTAAAGKASRSALLEPVTG